MPVGSAAILNDARVVYSPWDQATIGTGLVIGGVPVMGTISLIPKLLYIVCIDDGGSQGCVTAGVNQANDDIWIVYESGAAYNLAVKAFGQHALGIHRTALGIELVAQVSATTWKSWNALTRVPGRSGSMAQTSQGLLGFSEAGDPIWTADPLDEKINGWQVRLKRWVGPTTIATNSDSRLADGVLIFRGTGSGTLWSGNTVVESRLSENGQYWVLNQSNMEIVSGTVPSTLPLLVTSDGGTIDGGQGEGGGTIDPGTSSGDSSAPPLLTPSMTPKLLTSTTSFEIAAADEVVVTLAIQVVSSSRPGRGRIIHPILGAFDYDVKPDEWVNIDKDAIVPPLWANTRTMASAANVLWDGIMRDVTVEERWKGVGGLSMPITQLRMLLAIWTNPLDPDVGYVYWEPNYISDRQFKVLPLMLTAGGQGITLDDVTNYKDEDGNPIGWVTAPVTFAMRLVEHA